MLPGGYSYNYLTSFALKNSGLTMHVAQINESTLYMLPYYLGEDGSYEKPKDDVINASDMAEYTMSYYSFPKIAKYYDQVMGNLGEYAPYEAEYRKFVHQVYTKVDSETRAYMERIIKEKGFKKDDPAVITKIAEYIQNAADYNLQYDKAMDQEHNVAIAFLDTYKEGICVHYDTAATLLYRSLGIPARYVHGFAIETQKNDYVDITNPGHAWVEVYIDGLGWISVEVTGSLFQLPEEKTFNMKLKFGEPRYVEIAPRFNIKPYDGKTLYPTGELDVSPLLADLLKEGYTYTCTIEGSQREVGTSQTTITDFKIFDPKGKDVTERFIVVKKTGLLEVIPASQKIIRVYLYQVQKYYDGQALTFRSDDYEILSMDSGLRLSLSLKMSMLNAGYLSLSDINTHLSDYVSYQVYKGNSTVTKSYRLVFDVMSETDLSYIPMRVDPRPLELTTPSISKMFDGKPLSAKRITISGGKLCQNDSLFAIVDVELEDIGKIYNMIEEEPFMVRNQDGINVTYNYDITVSPGILEIIAGTISTQS
jgi:hypothetical protein